MANSGVVLINPQTGVREQTWIGFSWPCLLFGVTWFLYKRMYAWAAISMIAAISSGFIAWFLFPFFANDLHRNNLVKDGWVPEDQAGDFGITTEETHTRCPDCMELIRKDARVCKHCGAIQDTTR